MVVAICSVIMLSTVVLGLAGCGSEGGNSVSTQSSVVSSYDSVSSLLEDLPLNKHIRIQATVVTFNQIPYLCDDVLDSDPVQPGSPQMKLTGVTPDQLGIAQSRGEYSGVVDITAMVVSDKEIRYISGSVAKNDGSAETDANDVDEVKSIRPSTKGDEQHRFMEQVSRQYADVVGGYTLDKQDGNILHVRVVPAFDAKQDLDDLAESLGLEIVYDRTDWSINAIDQAALVLTDRIGSDDIFVTPDYEQSKLIAGARTKEIADRAKQEAQKIFPPSSSGSTSSEPIDIIVNIVGWDVVDRAD